MNIDEQVVGSVIIACLNVSGYEHLGYKGLA